MPVIFGREIPTKTLWTGGGLIAIAVAVVVFVRARVTASAPPETAQVSEEQDYGMSVAAPTGQVADQFQQQLQNSELEANAIANRYQANLVAQQQKQFDFQQSQMEALAPDYLARERAALSVETHFQKSAAKAAVSCPGDASVRTDPATGQLYCRQKTSGSWGPIPVGDLVRTVKGFVYGAEAAAPSIGYEASRQAASYYTGKLFPPKTVSPTSGNPAAKPAPRPPTTFTPGIASHGYGDIV